MATLSFWLSSGQCCQKAALLESVAARPGYNLCLSTHSNAVALLGHALGTVMCIKPSKALGKILCV